MTSRLGPALCVAGMLALLCSLLLPTRLFYVALAASAILIDVGAIVQIRAERKADAVRRIRTNVLAVAAIRTGHTPGEYGISPDVVGEMEEPVLCAGCGDVITGSALGLPGAGVYHPNCAEAPHR